MRLINTVNLQFQFLDPKQSVYAIISHRWSEEEVSYQDFLRDRYGEHAGSGWEKIDQGCHRARADGLKWLWIDTCCINKDSSAELTESINSMYMWYERSKLCYVFLPDVASISGDERSNVADEIYRLNDAYPFYVKQFKSSSWFTRGWTLQEQLAPEKLLFLNSKYEYIGCKQELAVLLSEASGIDLRHTRSSQHTRMACVAERMRWAARRTTSREEDMAYSLLGIFDVNMPLLYGEGRTNAFIRLQLEIIKKSDDETIFAWNEDPENRAHHFPRWFGFLAREPSLFAVPSEAEMSECYRFRPVFAGSFSARAKDRFQYRHPYNMTNKGLEFTLDIPDSSQLSEKHMSGYKSATILLPLNCVYDPCPSRLWHEYSEAVHQLALLLHVTVDLDGEVLRGERFDKLLRGDMRDASSLEALGSTPACAFDLPLRYGIIGAPGPSKRWKVYIGQAGL